ncbi:MAG: AMP-binding protein [Kiritimatiellales bacterium]|nr:AMP-binding protein [Kiritimatiellales bacterium]MCF7863449.1 AMP-binding protein [Kiritimatiellales bacterium]
MTIKDILNRAADESPDRIALKFKRDGAWRTTSFAQLRERAWHVSEMLASFGVAAGDRVALYRENSPEWYELYYGIVAIGAIAVPVDVKLREMEVAHIFHDCGVSVVFCSAKNVDVIQGLDGRLHELRKVVVLDAATTPLSTGQQIDYLGYDELWREVSAVAMSASRAYDRHELTDDSPSSFIYTSGTTGRQKGAVLTHRNFISNVVGIAKAIEVRKTDNFMLVLPLHHSFAFTAMLLLPIYAQCQVSLVENLKTIAANMAETAPTVLLAVPLLLEKMLARIMEGINAKKSARLMYRYGLAKVVGRKIHQGLGGSLRMIVSGGAPISPATLNAWNMLGFNTIEGYGITETAPVLTLNPPESPRVGTVGLPIPGVEIKIINPNIEGVGEIIARGDNVMQGYHNNPEETGMVLRDGWYYSGDLGYFDEKGYLVISGRKKSMIVNREGKNIYPEEVERQVLESNYVLECLSLGYREPGEDTGERIGLIVVPNQAAFDALEDHTGQRLTDQQIEVLLRDDVRKQLTHLSDYKRPRKIQIRFEEFEKTTTQKVKRYLYAIDTQSNNRSADKMDTDRRD